MNWIALKIRTASSSDAQSAKRNSLQMTRSALTSERFILAEAFEGVHLRPIKSFDLVLCRRVFFKRFLHFDSKIFIQFCFFSFSTISYVSEKLPRNVSLPYHDVNKSFWIHFRQMFVCIIVAAEKSPPFVPCLRLRLHHRNLRGSRPRVQIEMQLKAARGEQWADKLEFVGKSHRRYVIVSVGEMQTSLLPFSYRQFSPKIAEARCGRHKWFGPKAHFSRSRRCFRPVDGARARRKLWIAFRMVMSAAAVTQLTFFRSFLSTVSMTWSLFHLSSSRWCSLGTARNINNRLHSALYFRLNKIIM